MKRNFYKFVTIFATAALGTGFLEAQPTVYKRSFGPPPENVDIKSGEAVRSFIKPILPTSNVKRANSQGGHKLTIKLKFGEGYANSPMPTYVRIQNSTGFYEMAVVPPGETEAVLTDFPGGTYDVLTDFSNPLEDECYDRVVIKENVVIDSDTELTLASDDATIRLQYDYKNIDGEFVTVNEAEMSEDGTSATITKKGNSLLFSVDNGVSAKEYSGGFSMSKLISGDLYPDFDILRLADLYISPVSDRWLITNVCIVEDNEHTVSVVKYRQDGASESKQIVNDPSRFIAYEEKFTQSPIGKATGKSPRFGLTITDITDGYTTGGGTNVGFELPSDGIAKYYVDALDDSELKNPTHQIRIQPVFVDFEGEEDYSYLTTDAVPVNIAKKSVNYEVVGNLSSGFNYEKGPFHLESAYKPHKAFSYSASQKTGNFGGSAPIAMLEQRSYVNEEGAKLLGFDGFDYTWSIPNSASYVGRLGEERYADLYSMTFSLKYNGKEILNDYSKLSEFSMQWDSEKHADGAYNLTMLNENIEVDGVKGKNYTVVDFDFRKDDRIAPTLTMLQFRNRADLVTDRFENADDGKIMLSAGDFTYNYIPEEYGGLFTCKAANVTVEYSPYSNDTWLPLSVEENPEYYQAPGFGNYYEGSLSKITTNGWHDVRITVTDDAGNRQQQVISPAFKIGKDAGISTTDSADGIYVYLSGKAEVRVVGVDSAAVSVYNTAGALVAHSADGVANPISIASLPSGIYVAKVSAPGKNVTITKIIK